MAESNKWKKIFNAWHVFSHLLRENGQRWAQLGQNAWRKALYAKVKKVTNSIKGKRSWIRGKGEKVWEGQPTGERSSAGSRRGHCGKAGKGRLSLGRRSPEAALSKDLNLFKVRVWREGPNERRRTTSPVNATGPHIALVLKSGAMGMDLWLASTPKLSYGCGQLPILVSVYFQGVRRRKKEWQLHKSENLPSLCQNTLVWKICSCWPSFFFKTVLYK